MASFDGGSLDLRHTGTAFRRFAKRVASVRRGAIVAGACLIALAGSAQSAPKASKTLGFVITTWEYAIPDTRFADECPRGFTIGSLEIWWRDLSKAARAKATDNGNLDDADKYPLALARGPNKEDVCLDPTVVKDPPMLIVEGATAAGMNLDGTSDGHPTAKTCAHQKFTGPNGEPAVDNQMYRLLGCIYGWHKYENLQSNSNINRKMSGLGIILIEVSGVDDMRNDPDVTVNIYHAVDQYALDGQSDFLPFASYRIDTARGPDGKYRFGGTVHGKIVDGVLTTEPMDTILPFYGNFTYMNEIFRDFRIRMTISQDGDKASGLAAGYFDVNQFVYYMGGLGVVAYPSRADCPAINDAAHRLADGYPDPKTGECTMLSSAYNFEAISAFVIHPADRADTAPSDGPHHRRLTSLGLDKSLQ